MAKWLQRIGLLILGIFFALIALEVLTRIFWEKASGLEHVSSISFVTSADYKKISPRQFIWPGQKENVKEFSVEVNLNSHSFHDVEHPLAKPENAFRILVLGDSFTEAHQVPLAQAYTRILEADLSQKAGFPVEVISMARSATGTQNHFRALESLGLSYKPDLVIMQFLTNDLIDDDPRLGKEDLEEREVRRKSIPPLAEVFPRYLLWQGSRFSQVLALKLARLYQGHQATTHSHLDKYHFFYLNALIVVEEYAAMWEDAWKNTEGFILQTKELAEANGADFLLVSFAEIWRVGTQGELVRRMKSMNRRAAEYHWDFAKPDRILQAFCKERQIRFLSLLPAFNEAYLKNRKPLHYIYDGHMNERGHALAEKTIADYLTSQELLRKRFDF